MATDLNELRRPVGLAWDYALVKPANANGYVGWLDSMLEKALGHAGAHRVRIRTDVIDKCDVCRVDVPASTRPIWAKAQDVKVFFERRKNSTPGRVIPSDEVQAFIAERFDPSGAPSAGERS